MSDEHQEKLARLRAEMDQTREAQKEGALALWDFFNSCVEAGFSRSEALELVKAQLTAALRNPPAEET